MQFGYGVGGGTTAIESTRRRWLAVLLAFLIGAAMVLVGVSPANADVAAHHTGSLSADYDGECSVDVRFSNPNEGDHHWFKVESWEIREAEGGPTLIALPVPMAQLPASSSTPVETVLLPAGVYKAEAFAVYSALHSEDGFNEDPDLPVTSDPFDVDCDILQVIQCTGIACESFSDPNEDWEADCTGCAGQVIIRDPGNQIADITVTQVSGPDIHLELVTTKLPSPGHTGVFVNDAEKIPDGDLPKCNGKNPTNCFTAKRIQGAFTFYTVWIDEDPRFRFR